MTATLATSSTPVIVAVGPTTTTVLEADTRFVEDLAVQVTNLDATQTFTGSVTRRTWQETVFSTSPLPDFEVVPPGASVMADLDVRGSAVTRLVGTMSGAGGNVQVSYVRRAAK